MEGMDEGIRNEIVFLREMKSQGIDGNCLPDYDTSALNRIKIPVFQHRKAIAKRMTLLSTLYGRFFFYALSEIQL